MQDSDIHYSGFIFHGCIALVAYVLSWGVGGFPAILFNFVFLMFAIGAIGRGLEYRKHKESEELLGR